MAQNNSVQFNAEKGEKVKETYQRQIEKERKREREIERERKREGEREGGGERERQHTIKGPQSPQ